MILLFFYLWDVIIFDSIII